MLLLLASFLLSAPPNSGSHPGWCEASPRTRRELKKAQGDWQNSDAARSARLKAYQSLLAAQPLNLDIHLAYQADAGRDGPDDEPGTARKSLIRQYREQAQSHPNVVEWQYLYANLLLDADTPQAIRIAEEWSGKAASFPRTHLLLANANFWGKFKNPEKFEREILAFYDLCRGSLLPGASAYAVLVRSADHARTLSAVLRKRLERESDPDLLERWATVWDLDFKARNPAEHAALRQRITADLARIVKTHTHAGDAAWYNFLRASHKSAGDLAASKRAEDTLIERFPQSWQAARWENERWYAAHPFPADNPEKQQAFYKADLDRAQRRLAFSPDDVSLLWVRFTSLSHLPSTRDDELTEAADRFLSRYEKDRSIMMSPPPQIEIADAYVKRKIRLDRIASLVEAGRKLDARMNGPWSDRNADERKDRATETDAAIDLQAATTLASAALVAGKPDIARAAVAKIESIQLERPWMRYMQLGARAKFAEAEGRRLDALLLYRAQLDARTGSQNPKGSDEVADAIARLKKELGATAETDLLWNPRKRADAAATVLGWTKPLKPWKSWELTDLSGKPLKLAQCQGKTILVNVWATWCGPCRAEHPHLQKLYERLKGRTDVQILSFNVDEEIGQVAPYLKEHNYTFPVLLASDFVNDLLPSLSIPQNWIADGTGTWQWQQIGFGNADAWEREVTEKLK